MALTKRQLDEHLAFLQARAASPDATPADHDELKAFQARLKIIKAAPEKDRSVERRFVTQFRSTGLVRRKKLWAEYVNSGLSYDDWLARYRALNRRLLRARDALQRSAGLYKTKITDEGRILVLRDRAWQPFGTLDLLFPLVDSDWRPR